MLTSQLHAVIEITAPVCNEANPCCAWRLCQKVLAVRAHRSKEMAGKFQGKRLASNQYINLPIIAQVINQAEYVNRHFPHITGNKLL